MGQDPSRPAASGISRPSPVAAAAASDSGASGSVAVRPAVPHVETADGLQVESDERGELPSAGTASQQWL